MNDRLLLYFVNLNNLNMKLNKFLNKLIRIIIYY